MKKKGPVIIIVIIVAIIFALGLCGIGGYFIYNNFIKEKVSNLVGDELAEEAIEDATGGNVEIDSDDESISIESDDTSINIEEGQDWPENISSDVPEFTYGTIYGVTESSDEDGTYWYISLQSVDSDAYANYKSDLEDNGWEINYTQSYEETNSLTATKGDDAISVSINSEESTGSIMVSIKE